MIRAVLCLGLAMAGTSADACSRKDGPPSLAETLAGADEVFVARLVSAREKSFREDGELEPFIEGRYRLIEQLKGKSSRSGTVHDLPYGPGNCSIGLMVGWDYVFVVKRGDRPLSRWVGMFSGSFGLGPYRDIDEGDAEEQDLAKVRTILKEQREIHEP